MKIVCLSILTSLPFLTLFATPASAANGVERLGGACVVELDENTTVSTVSFELDDVTRSHFFHFGGSLGGELLFLQGSFEVDDAGVRTATLSTVRHNPWAAGASATLEKTQTHMLIGETIKLYDVADGYNVHCEASLFEAPTKSVEVFYDELHSADVDTARLSIGVPVPNQIACGVRFSFPNEGRVGLLAELVKHLEITALAGDTELEVQDYEATLTIRTTYTGYYDRIIVESTDRDTALGALIGEVLYGDPFAGKGTFAMVACPATSSPG